MHDLGWADTPFDTLTVHLTASPAPTGDEPVPRLAVAAWLAVIREAPADAAALLDEARHAAREAAVTAGAPGRPDPGDAAVLGALGAVLDAFAGGGEPGGGDAVEALAELVRVPAVPPPAWLGALAYLEAANWLTFLDRYDDAGRMVDLVLLHARRGEDAVAEVWTRCCQAELDLRRGRWGRARLAVADALRLSERHGMAAGYAHVLAARAAALTGRDAELVAHLAAARADAYDRGDRSTLWRADAVDGLAALAAGLPERAVALLGRLAEGPVAGGPDLAAVRQWDVDLIEALVHLDARAEAAAALKRLELEPPHRWTVAALRRGEALLADDACRALALAEESAERFDRLGAPFEAARSELVAGELARRARQLRVARHCLTRALAAFEGLGALRWAERAQRELAACGGAPAPLPVSALTPAQPTRSGDADGGGDGSVDAWAALLARLTAQEREVVREVAAGASNREIATRLFISIKTVETHLTRAYRKLQVQSRTQLVALVGGAAR